MNTFEPATMKKKHVGEHSWLLDALEQKGFRHTAPRQAVCSYLASCQGMISAAMVQQALPAIDRVSIYRTLELLASFDLIHPTLIHDGHQYYELHQTGEEHHHHAFCTSCTKVVRVPCSVPDMQAEDFGPLHHETHYTGLCLSCSAKKGIDEEKKDAYSSITTI